MKKATTLMLVLFLSLTAICQQNPAPAKPDIDSSKIPLISIAELEAFAKFIQKAPYDEYIKLNPMQVLNELLNWKIEMLKPRRNEPVKAN